MFEQANDVANGFLQFIDSKEVWIAFSSALLGGAFTLAGSFFSIKEQFRREEKRTGIERKRNHAERAFAVFSNLIAAYNELANIKGHIDRMFAEANDAGHADMEPCSIVRPIVGAEKVINEIVANDLAFLFQMQKAELFNDVILSHARSKNLFAAIAKYNHMRSEVTSFMIEGAEGGKTIDGVVATRNLQGERANEAELKIGQLNNLLGQILEMLDADVKETWRVASSFNEAAKIYFGQYYPKFELEKLS